LAASWRAIEQQTHDTNKQANPAFLLQLHLFQSICFAAVACVERVNYSLAGRADSSQKRPGWQIHQRVFEQSFWLIIKNFYGYKKA
jgi:hypothetical protein